MGKRLASNTMTLYFEGMLNSPHCPQDVDYLNSNVFLNQNILKYGIYNRVKLLPISLENGDIIGEILPIIYFSNMFYLIFNTPGKNL